MLRLLLLLPVVASIAPLRCHVEQNGHLNQTHTTNATDCINAYSCLKLVDFTLGTYQKMCNIGNCTQENSFAYAPAHCRNTTEPPRYPGEQVRDTQQCCCYGDGCNSTPNTFSWPTILLFIVTMTIAIK